MKTALKITGIYFIVGMLWILVSDQMVMMYFGDDAINIQALQTYKGILFVVVTAVILLLLLKKHYRNLDRKITQLEELNTQLQHSNRELEQFAYVASHDLQEPLRMVSSFLTQLEDKYAGKLDKKAHQYIYYAVDGAKRMRQIILDLLEYSRIGEENIKKESIALEEIIDQFCETHKSEIDTKKARFHFNGLPVINNNRTSITQIFHNLLDNALKFSKEGVAPEITITAEDRDTFWQFSIADNGIGIAEESADEIFVIFRRLQEREKYTGTGIGLAIVKKNVEKRNGTIWVQSESSKGTTFTFTLQK